MSPSLALRAFLALTLTVTFYLLAIGLSVGLLGLAWLDVTAGSRVHPRLVFACVAGAGALLWATVPRRERFEPPGPELSRDAQPRLFAVIDEVAAQTGQRPPDHVYVVGTVNAFVSQVDTWLGLGGRRVMGLGLPLLQVLSVRQLRGVIAHEFGHFHGGDTALGPWIYRTRAAIGRAVDHLESIGSWLSWIFHGYAWLFLRVTHAISRAQEHAADALAARTQGADALAGGLRAIAAADAAFDAYWRNEVAAVLSRRLRPPISAGFATFLAVPGIDADVRRLRDQRLADTAVDPADTHPPLALRIAAVGDPPGSADEGPRGTSLLDDLGAVEAALLAHAFGAEAPTAEIGWDQVGAQVHLPRLRASGATVRAALGDVRIADVDVSLPAQVALAEAAGAEPAEIRDPEALRERVIGALGAAVLTALVDAGGTITSPVGEPLAVVRDGRRLDLWPAVRARVTGETDDAAWRAWCEELGIADVSLAPVATAA